MPSNTACSPPDEEAVAVLKKDDVAYPDEDKCRQMRILECSAGGGGNTYSTGEVLFRLQGSAG